MSRLVLAGGACVVLVGGVLTLAPWYAARHWQAPPEAARAERNAVAPTPIWLTPTPASRVSTGAAPATRVPTPPAQPTASAPLRAPAPVLEPTVSFVDNAPPQTAAAAPTPTPSVSDLELTSAAFVFEDPPEPGAHVRLSLTVHNPTAQLSDAFDVALPVAWLSGYRLEGTDPPLIGGDQSHSAVRLSFAGPDATSDADVSVEFVTTDEVIDAPSLTVYDSAGREVGRAHPPTQAPPPRPGPVYSIDVPRLRLHAGVVPVDWEPPLFVVGQVRASANVMLGNSVLVGHLNGAPGYNVFSHLDQLTPGDQVIANSRGEAYDFVVTQTEVLPADDTTPTQATRTPRLTLMTCAGDWDPIARDYPDRLWIIAEPSVTAAPVRGPD